MARQRKKPTKESPQGAVPDLGPLPWLVAFANIGFDDRTPRGLTKNLDRSRALGYLDAETGTARRGEVFFDPESRPVLGRLDKEAVT